MRKQKKKWSKVIGEDDWVDGIEIHFIYIRK
jgi:hypothetical protein